jgi:hypothetical protein
MPRLLSSIWISPALRVHSAAPVALVIMELALPRLLVILVMSLWTVVSMPGRLSMPKVRSAVSVKLKY